MKNRGKLCLRHFLLRAGAEVANLRAATGNLVAAKDHGNADTGTVGLFQSLADGPASRKVDGDPGTAQRLGQREGSAFGVGIHRHYRHARRGRLHITDKHGKPLHTGSPADTRHGRAAKHLGQTVIAPATKYSALRAKGVSDEFKSGVAVIIETAHKQRVEAPGNAGAVQRAGHAVKMPA